MNKYWDIIVDEIYEKKGFECNAAALNKYESFCSVHKRKDLHWHEISLENDEIFQYVNLNIKDSIFKVIRKGGHIQKMRYYTSDLFNYVRAVILAEYANDYIIFICEYMR